MRSLFLASVIALPSLASAATFSEPPEFSGQTLGALGVGTTTVTGAIAFDCVDEGFVDCNPESGGDDSQDTFAFTLANTLRIDSVTIASTGSGPEGFAYSFATRGAEGFAFLEPSLAASSATGNLLTAPLLGDRSFSVYGQTADAPGAFSVDYTVTIEVDGVPAIPLPATGVLLAGAVGALALRRRRTAR